MIRQFADRTTRSRTTPPTQAEFAEARAKGKDSITGAELTQMRTEARQNKRAPAKATSEAPAPTLQQYKTKVQQQAKVIEKLRNEVTMLQVKLMLS